ncbi:uncharacterized protein LOC126354255 [Schistocerca gregaria]|uniref:uncharacterized protein LOC126354255 n=1 Tax=Schistocerca gregaria TaxID=7010 RepID=UPI00211DD5E1|nr:uncharacterized protein LOC126354255 [Schistocerca gregaria]
MTILNRHKTKDMAANKSLWHNKSIGRHRGFRKRHIELMAKPNWRRVQRTKIKDIPNLNLGEGMIWPIRRAALNYKTSERIKILATPKNKVVPIPEYLLPRPAEHLTGMYPGGHYASPTAMRAISNKRVQELALPKYIYVINTREEFETLRGPKFVKYLEDLAKKIAEVYPPPEIIRISEMKPEKIKLTKKERDRMKKWITIRSKPKKEHEPPKIRPKRVKLRKLRATFNRLSRPLERRKPQVEPDPFKVSPAALRYEASPRMIELAKPKERFEDRGLIPGQVKRAALRYKITQRILDLAQPRERPM